VLLTIASTIFALCKYLLLNITMLNITVLSAPAPLSTERSSSLDSGPDWQSLNSAQAGGDRGPSRHLNTALKGLKALKALKVLKK